MFSAFGLLMIDASEKNDRVVNYNYISFRFYYSTAILFVLSTERGKPVRTFITCCGNFAKQTLLAEVATATHRRRRTRFVCFAKLIRIFHPYGVFSVFAL